MDDPKILVEVKLLVYLKCSNGEILKPGIYRDPIPPDLIKEVKGNSRTVEPVWESCAIVSPSEFSSGSSEKVEMKQAPRPVIRRKK